MARISGHANIFAKTKEFVLMQIVIFLTEYSLNIYSVPAQLKQGVENKATVAGLKFNAKK